MVDGSGSSALGPRHGSAPAKHEHPERCPERSRSARREIAVGRLRQQRPCNESSPVASDAPSPPQDFEPRLQRALPMPFNKVRFARLTLGPRGRKPDMNIQKGGFQNPDAQGVSEQVDRTASHDIQTKRTL